jgi:predicted DNA-binding antitoxin AbrB/MazE fold protein
LPATVEKIIKPIVPTEPERAQIVIEGADHLYREVRIENTLTDENGEKVRLKPGAEVEVTIAAEPEATTAED